ncbi:hypothetical protein ALI22I_17575 [Saccharothrix sp. ALI-22-I]|nr:hypothetical protein ALI22I_17575 [Saccharothrix sp. ALI-22-I]
MFALEMLSRPNNVYFSNWIQRVNTQLGSRAHAIRAIIKSTRPVPDLLFTLESSRASEKTTRSSGLSSSEILAAVDGFCRLAVMPNWRRMLRYLEAERDARGRILTTGGVERLLGTLHPQVKWNPPVLEVPDEREGDVRLNGRSLLLAPSLFLVNKSAVLIDADRADGQPILSFASPPDLKAANGLWEMWDEYDRGDQALSALVGRTRAAVLLALADTSSTTGELADRLRVSAAAISQHTGVLRAAGLISTRRNRNMVLHTLNPLGTALLSGDTLDSAHLAAIPQPNRGLDGRRFSAS